MSMPFDQPPPAPTAIIQRAYTSHSGKGSIGPVIGVLAVITILGIFAAMIGRLCAGRRIMGHGQYDFEGWIERKCASCIDGRIEVPSSVNGGTGGSVPVAVPVEIPEETKQQPEEVSLAQSPPATTGSS